MFQVRFCKSICFLLFVWLLAVTIPVVGRIYLSYFYIPHDLILVTSSDFIRLFTIGLIFDIRVACIAFSSLFVLSLIFCAIPKLFKLWLVFIRWISIFIITIILVFTLINIFYYLTYDRHIDVFIFGLIDDDTTAILKTVWRDYPIIKGLIALIIFIVTLSYILKRYQQWLLQREDKAKNALIMVPSYIGLFILLAIGIRGGVGTFPLRQADAQISTNRIINTFVPNGLIAMEWAYKGYKIDSEFGIGNKKQTLSATEQFFDSKEVSLANFAGITSQNLIIQQNPPHIVLAVMESMGNHIFQLDNPERDLYGDFREPWLQDWHFSRFLSEGNGTIDTLNRFFVRSPISKISQSSYQSTHFTSNMFKPFLDQGYKVIYITAGNGSWQNLNNFLLNLGVSEFIEQNTLIKTFPEAEVTTWGVPDEYMFKYAEQRLAQANANGEKLFIMMMSITNHPPYELSENISIINYPLNDNEIERFKSLGSKSEIIKMLNTFHYSNDQLGKFISRIKNSDNGSKIIIAATGDHRMRGVNYPEPYELFLKHSVPFYLYVPTYYQQNSYYDSSRIGSHKDIFPTLYHLALSDTRYYQTGCNILAKELDNRWCDMGYNVEALINQFGIYTTTDDQFYPWKDEEGVLVKSSQVLSNDQLKEFERWKHMNNVLLWQLSQQLQ